MAFYNNAPCGFIELADNGYIDCFYMMPNYQGLGIGNALYNHLEYIAINTGVKQLWMDTSKVAKPFFLKRCFLHQKQHLIKRNEVALINYSLSKRLD